MILLPGVYTIQIGVSNKSTRAGLPTKATLGLEIWATIGATTILSKKTFSALYEANETRIHVQNLTIPVGNGSGNIVVQILDPNAHIIESVSVPFEIGKILEHNKVYGYVKEKDSNIPIVGATVQLSQPAGSISVYTDSQGYYKFDNVEISDYMTKSMSISREGYETFVAQNLNLILGDNIFNFWLKKVTILTGSISIAWFRYIRYDEEEGEWVSAGYTFNSGQKNLKAYYTIPALPAQGVVGIGFWVSKDNTLGTEIWHAGFTYTGPRQLDASLNLPSLAPGVYHLYVRFTQGGTSIGIYQAQDITIV